LGGENRKKRERHEKENKGWSLAVRGDQSFLMEAEGVEEKKYTWVRAVGPETR